MSAAFFKRVLARAAVAAHASAESLDAVARDLARRYAEPVRAYHNQHHIEILIDALEAAEQSKVPSSELQFAILFHDAIYDPRRHDNEASSADLATRALGSLGVDRPTIVRTSALIRATHHGAVSIDPGDEECALLLDLDLAVLAGSPTDYCAYAEAIRKEYAHVPDELYRTGRARVLQMFLDQPYIFRQVDFRVRHEAAARANLAAEIVSLLNPA